ncbi:MAG: DNA alkylation repair protein, partial [Flavobacteriales bacterium]|nr:DNA alkylation repair protein [Flavobacteriales bacterium]
KEFFINKAIGWALREYGKTGPEFVRDYVKRMEVRMHTLSVREATRNLL